MARLRRARVCRRTTETDVRVELSLDGRGHARVCTGIRFFDHMLEQVARHGGFDLVVEARGDLDVDQHHTVEDVGLVLGTAFRQALGSRRGIQRAGYFLMPMDESLAVAAVDFSGRPCAVCRFRIGAQRVGDFSTELVRDFFEAFARAAGAAVHLHLLYGRSSHHRLEALFKAFGRALRWAVARDRRLAGVLPSTKELL